MPYNPRSVSEGGNRGIDDQFSRYAPPNQFRVIGVDTFDGTDWHEDDFEDLETAKEHADKKVEGENMMKMHIYNDAGKHVYSAGNF